MKSCLDMHVLVMLSSCNYFAWSTNTPWFQIYIWYRSGTETLHKQQSSIQTNHHKIDKKCSQDCHWKAPASVLALCAVGNPKLGGLIMKPISDFMYGLYVWWMCDDSLDWQKVQLRLSSVLSSWGLFSCRKYICGEDRRSWLIHGRLLNNGSCFCCHACRET